MPVCVTAAAAGLPIYIHAPSSLLTENTGCPLRFGRLAVLGLRLLMWSKTALLGRLSAINALRDKARVAVAVAQPEAGSMFALFAVRCWLRR